MESNPTTVRGWLETLPEPLRERAIESSSCLDQFPRPVWQTLPQVLYAMYLHGNSYFWLGVRHYVCGVGEDQTFDGECRIGYNAAKAAYELAKSQETESTNGKEYGVSFVSVSAERLAELEAKEKVFDDMVIALGRYYSRKEQGNG